MRWLIENAAEMFSPTIKDVIFLCEDPGTIFAFNRAGLCYGWTKYAIETIVESFKVVRVSSSLYLLSFILPP